MVSSPTRAFGAPMKYIQGPGEYKNIEIYTRGFGRKAFFLIDRFLFENLNSQLQSIFEGTESSFAAEPFAGECCKEESERVGRFIRDCGADVVVAMGGGKTLDTGKIIANEMNLPLIAAPTSASTDAPTSAMSVVYTQTGEYIGSVRHKRNADIVLIDTDVVAKAPIRLFIAGMGDALATYIEAKANEASDSANYVGKGYRRCKTSMAIAKMCWEIILEDGVKALAALKRGVSSEAVENVIEANTLMSGLGFENAGCAAAHGIHAGLTELPETHSFLHGEKVAFGIVCQMVLENAASEEMDKVIGFLVEVGLPVTLAQLGVEPKAEKIKVVADKVALHNPLIRAEPFFIDETIVFNAIVLADEIGRQYLEKAKR